MCTCRKVGRVKSGRMGKEEEKGQEKRGGGGGGGKKKIKTNGKIEKVRYIVLYQPKFPLNH